MQSPVDLNNEVFVQDDFGDMQMMMWQESFFGVHLYDGSFHDTVKLNFTKGKLTFLDVDGSMSYYKFTEFHIHSPSDHTFNGKHYNVEMHLVH
jgi:carbonic anhydrase